MPPAGQPAITQGSIRSGGNVAKWAPAYGLLATVQTERLFLVADAIVLPLLVYEYFVVDPLVGWLWSIDEWLPGPLAHDPTGLL